MTGIGFIGAGRMGGAVACHLAEIGHDVCVYDPDAAAVAACEAAGARRAATAGDAAGSRAFVITSLPTTELVVDTWSELAPRLDRGAIAIDVSTVDPQTARAAADACAASGVGFIACGLGKGPDQARAGAIPLFVGGGAEAVARARPLLGDIGDVVHHLGSVEAAAAFKLVSNLLGMTNLAVLAEGHALARRAGIDDDAFAAALADTGGRSYQSDVRLPWMSAGDHRARFAVDLAAKDLRLAVELAARSGVPAPVGAQGLMALVSASAQGFGADDVTSVARIHGDGG